MAGLPKKYAKMGFKKGWKMFKAAKSKRRTSPRRASTKTKVRKVARKKYKKFARRVARRGISPGGMILPAALYGAGREQVSGFLGQFTQNVPFGDVSDELVLGIGGYFLAKKAKMKLLKDIGMAALTVEAARVGEAAVTGTLMGAPKTSGVTVIG